MNVTITSVNSRPVADVFKTSSGALLLTIDCKGNNCSVCFHDLTEEMIDELIADLQLHVNERRYTVVN